MAAKLSPTQTRERKLRERTAKAKRDAAPRFHAGMRSLESILAGVEDPRSALMVEHKLFDILAIALLATICDSGNWVDIAGFGAAKEEWLGTFLELPNGIPSHDTFDRVFGLVDPDRLEACYGEWMAEVAKRYKGRKLKVVAIDGKTAKGSAPRGRKALHVVSAWSARNRLCLGQVACAEKSNEITAIPKLLRVLALEGALVTIDAMGCQKEIARTILGRKADYLLAVKGNQERLHDDIRAYAVAALEAGYEGIDHTFHETSGKGHGRIEYRCCRVFPDLSGIRDRADWPGLACIVEVTTDRTIGGKGSSETRYYISSRLLSARQALEASRGHWGVENRLHWVLDVVFGEDANREANGRAQQNLNVFRKLSLAAIRTADGKDSLRVRRKRAGWDNDYLMHVVGNSLEI